MISQSGRGGFFPTRRRSERIQFAGLTSEQILEDARRSQNHARVLIIIVDVLVAGPKQTKFGRQQLSRSISDDDSRQVSDGIRADLRADGPTRIIFFGRLEALASSPRSEF